MLILESVIENGPDIALAGNNAREAEVSLLIEGCSPACPMSSKQESVAVFRSKKDCKIRNTENIDHEP